MKFMDGGDNSSNQLGLDGFVGFYTPQKLNFKNIQTISCGLYHTLAMVKSGEVYACGENGSGQLGVGRNYSNLLGSSHSISCTRCLTDLNKLDLKDVVSICCADWHSMALTKFGEVYVWGQNDNGELGLNHNKNRYLPKKLNLHNVILISCKGSRSVAVTGYGEVYQWGNGQLLPQKLAC